MNKEKQLLNAYPMKRVREHTILLKITAQTVFALDPFKKKARHLALISISSSMIYIHQAL